MAIDFEEGPDVKGGTSYMATYAMGVLPLREGLTGCVGSLSGALACWLTRAKGASGWSLTCLWPEKGGEA